MATDVEKMLDLIRRKENAGLPASLDGFSELRDETGQTMIKLGFKAHKDIIDEIGYFAQPDIPADMAAAMAQVCILTKGKAIMGALLINAEAIAQTLSNDGHVDECNEQAVEIASLMLRESLRNYAAGYNKAREERLHGRKKPTV